MSAGRGCMITEGMTADLMRFFPFYFPTFVRDSTPLEGLVEKALGPKHSTKLSQHETPKS